MVSAQSSFPGKRRFAYAALALAVLSCAVASIAQSCKFTYQIQQIPVGEHSISVELYQPDDAALHPLLMMIHGTAGAYTRRTPAMPEEDNFGEKTFAAHCYVVVLPHYFDALGRASMTNLAEARKDFPALRSVLEGVMAKSMLLPSVKGCPVVLFGESYGGFLAVSLGFRDPTVVAVSEFSGGLPLEDMEAHNSSLSLLIQHGAEDTLVPPANSIDLENYAKSHGAKVEKHIYAGQQHYFDKATQAAVLQSTLAFFDAALSAPKQAATPGPAGSSR